jgi:hypothetical protein
MIAVRPDAEMEVDSMSNGLRADELQHFQVAVAFFFRKVERAHFVAGDGKQKRIGEQEVGIANVVEKVVSDADIQTEAVTSLSGQHGKVCGPHFPVVEPGFVLNIAAKDASDAAQGVERLLGDCFMLFECGKRTLGVVNAVGKLEQRVHEAARIAAHENAASGFTGERQERQRLGGIGDRHS